MNRSITCQYVSTYAELVMGRPKGSRNKQKHHPKPPLKRTQLPQEASYCKICDRVPFGIIVPLGYRSWRHESCELGSEAWKDYYLALPKAHRQALEEFYTVTYTDLKSVLRKTEET
jgi:hypothetical protein